VGGAWNQQVIARSSETILAGLWHQPQGRIPRRGGSVVQKGKEFLRNLYRKLVGWRHGAKGETSLTVRDINGQTEPLSAVLVAHKLPRRDEPSHQAGGPEEAVGIVGGTPTVVNDSLADGNIKYIAAGRSRQGEEGTLETCRILIERLNQDGARWSQPERPDKEEGVDCQASDCGNRLKIQVTRAVIDREFWKALNLSGSVGGRWRMNAQTPYKRRSNSKWRWRDEKAVRGYERPPARMSFLPSVR
jgi:hypothetical protein